MSESKWREALSEALRAHGIYGFNGSQVACRCSQRNWRYVLDWHDHVADALSPVLAQMKREWQAEALLAASWEREIAKLERGAKCDAKAEGWDEAVKALAWALDNGPEADALRYVAENNPYRAEASGQEGER